MPHLPDALEMKILKYGSRPDAEKDEVARALREAGRRAEALLLFDGRPDHPFLREEIEWAVHEGQSFHLLSLRRLGAPVTPAHLEACGAEAERRERWLDARQCWLALGNEEAIQRIAEHLPQAFRPAPPEEGEGEGEGEGGA